MERRCGTRQLPNNATQTIIYFTANMQTIYNKEALGPTDHAICGNTTRYGPTFAASAGKAMAAAVSQAEVNGGYGEGRESSSAYAMASCLRTLDARMNNVSMKMASALSKSSLNFKYSTLAKATGSFDAANKLGEGGFGTVYKLI
ncbi:Cysteine-rich receptor-like protein kinase 2 [Acorus calamus]|uniref:Cysteine-rich receptor-like protein kinase 2 n=1 Tax=Acorus calamus TaxID=4465 RepID=A0AAV9DN67_ACOCL|nr:Cysteine-rich receptor-like protein kinase 2 [Acorus calamus]